MSDVTITYKGANIATMDATGSKTLQTAGTYCEGDIGVEYVKPGGGGSVSVARKDVNFIDPYDGAVVASYTTAEFAALTELPANPSHTGLTAQGWNMPPNWTLTDTKNFIAANKRFDWGQMYTTDDGKTHVHIHLEDGRTSPMLGCCPDGTVDVDWGDGTAHDTLTGTSVTEDKWTPTHNYGSPGDYTIKLTVTGSMGLVGSSSANQYCGLLRYSASTDARNRYYWLAIRSVNIGNNVTRIMAYSFHSCFNLASLTIPSGITYIGIYAFYNCYRLPALTIPSGIMNIDEYVANNCYSLMALVLPSSVTSIGSNALRSCYCVTVLTIPSGITNIYANAFNSCSGLSALHFTSAAPPTVSSSNAFSSIPTDCKIYVPTGSLSAYTSATNYPSSSTYTYIEE